MMKGAYKILIGNILFIHLFTHQYKEMMKEVFYAIQKRNISSFSFGRLLCVSCALLSRFHEIGNTFVRTKVQLAKQRQVCNKGEISVFRENVKKRDGEITKSCNQDFGTSKKHKCIFYFDKHCGEATMSI